MIRTLTTAACSFALPLILVLTAAPSYAQVTPVKADTLPHLSVRGEAELNKPADQLRLSVGVVTEHAEPNEALRMNTERMRRVVAAIEGVGLTDDEYETGRFQVQPVYSRRPARADADWFPQIVGYRVTNSVLVKTKQLELAGRIIETANKAGANSIDFIQFTLADARIHRAEAIGAATANALADANALAEAAGLRLVRIVSITLDDARPTPQPVYQRMGMEMAMAPDAEPPISPGDVTVRANVHVVYEIAPAE